VGGAHPTKPRLRHALSLAAGRSAGFNSLEVRAEFGGIRTSCLYGQVLSRRAGLRPPSKPIPQRVPPVHFVRTGRRESMHGDGHIHVDRGHSSGWLMFVLGRGSESQKARVRSRTPGQGTSLASVRDPPGRGPHEYRDKFALPKEMRRRRRLAVPLRFRCALLTPHVDTSYKILRLSRLRLPADSDTVAEESVARRRRLDRLGQAMGLSSPPSFDPPSSGFRLACHSQIEVRGITVAGPGLVSLRGFATVGGSDNGPGCSIE
jgi:hypothetical protein